MARPAAGRLAGRARVASLGLLLPYLRPYRGRVALAGLALAAAAGLVLGLGQGLRHLVDNGFSAASPAALDHAALVMGGLVAALAVATCGRYWLISWLEERVAGDLRRTVFDHLLTLSPAFYETARTGDILSRLTADVALIQSLAGSSSSQGIRNVLTGAGPSPCCW